MEDGEPMQIVAMYRIENEPSIWYHVLDTADLNDIVSVAAAKAIGLGNNVPRIEYKAFRDHGAASQVYSHVPCNGYFRTVKSTQELLKLKQVAKVTLPETRHIEAQHGNP